MGTAEEELKLINSRGRHKTFLGLTPHAPIWPFTLSLSSTNSHVLRLAYFQLIDDLLRVAFFYKFSDSVFSAYLTYLNLTCERLWGHLLNTKSVQPSRKFKGGLNCMALMLIFL